MTNRNETKNSSKATRGVLVSALSLLGASLGATASTAAETGTPATQEARKATGAHGAHMQKIEQDYKTQGGSTTGRPKTDGPKSGKANVQDMPVTKKLDKPSP
jgi:hypothetical protein